MENIVQIPDSFSYITDWILYLSYYISIPIFYFLLFKSVDKLNKHGVIAVITRVLGQSPSIIILLSIPEEYFIN